MPGTSLTNFANSETDMLNGISGTRYRIDGLSIPRLIHLANQAGGRSNIIRPPGKRSAHAAIRPRASSGCRYISRPSEVMNTPCSD